MNIEEESLVRGAENLLANCIGIKPGESVMVVTEQTEESDYDQFVPDFISQQAQQMGANTRGFVAPFVAGPQDIPAELVQAIREVDHTIFCARIGDQLRFSDFEGDGTQTMCYALSREHLGSEFSTLPNQLLEEILNKLESELEQVQEWQITCPLGTDVKGSCENNKSNGAGRPGFTLFNFPIGTFKPISCKSITGKVVLSNWITSSGLHQYAPDALVLDSAVTVKVDQGRMVGFEGDLAEVKKFKAHYEKVASRFDIDPWIVHSWHGGINPQTFYDEAPADNLWRWNTLTFHSPRRVHIHTCGDYAPAEISWSIFDATISFDGQVYWDKGEFVFLQREDIKEIINKYPGGESLFNMRTDLGV